MKNIVLHAQYFYFACRQRRSIENKWVTAEKRLEDLEDNMRNATQTATDADTRYDEVGATLIMVYCIGPPGSTLTD